MVEPVDERAVLSAEVARAVGVGLRFALAMACSISAVRVRPSQGEGGFSSELGRGVGVDGERRTGPVRGVLPHFAD